MNYFFHSICTFVIQLFVGVCIIAWAWNSVPVNKIRRWVSAINTTTKLYVSTSFESICVRIVSSTCETLHFNNLGHIKQKAVCWLNVSSQPFMEITRARRNSSNKYFCIIHYYSPTWILYTRDTEYFYSLFVPPSSTCFLRICSNPWFVHDWKFLNTWSNSQAKLKFNLVLHLQQNEITLLLFMYLSKFCRWAG
jgi:hypothetical protein